jgi:hypothetical protein
MCGRRCRGSELLLITGVGVINRQIADQVRAILEPAVHQPAVTVRRGWTAYFVCFTWDAVMPSRYEDDGLHHIILVGRVRIEQGPRVGASITPVQH